ncbi:SDR family NAD(P)-dependent oxidoreductase [Psychroflexus halocasei]|uniref:SDR family NAD(P)-dependent oxidoreductase n=1 Tax=Psychroflexus halocasei TaxID=908615 RepID=UPI000B88D6F4
MKKIKELFDFKGKVIIISGAAGAIGSEASRFLSSLGANVVMADLNEEKVKAYASDIEKETGNSTLAMKIDFTEENEIKKLVDATLYAELTSASICCSTASCLSSACIINSSSIKAFFLFLNKDSIL